jgi:zinc transporter 1/2/3
MNINVFKFIICISLFLETTLFGFLPLMSMKINSEIRIKILGLANAFAGGIFLSSGFIHLLGDNQEILTHELSTEIPIALICCSFGFLLIFFLEKVIFVEYHINHSSVHEENEDQPFLKKDTIYGTLESSSTNVLHHNHQNEGHHTHEHISGDPYSNSSSPHHIKVGKITPYILVIVMSIHSFISGIAMGVQSTIENTIPLLIAMVSHKWVESFAVGISLIRFGQTKKKYFVFNFIIFFHDSYWFIYRFLNNDWNK